MPEGTTRSRFMTIPAVAAELGVSRGTVYRLVRRNALPVTRIGEGPLRIPVAAFQDWLAAREREALASVVMTPQKARARTLPGLGTRAETIVNEDTPSLCRQLRDSVLAPVVRAREATEDGDMWLVEGALEAVEMELLGILSGLEQRRAA